MIDKYTKEIKSIFGKIYRIGTEVRYYYPEKDEKYIVTIIKSEPQITSEGKIVVRVDGISEYVEIDQITMNRKFKK